MDMTKIKYNLLFALFLVLACAPLRAQEAGSSELARLEKILETHFGQLAASQNDQARLQANEKIRQTMRQVLKIETSFSYPFEKLKNLSKLTSDDELLRVYTWNMPKDNGTYQYFGFTQYYLKKQKKYAVHELHDFSHEITNPETASLTAKKWYGALYYEIVTTEHKRKTYYTLIGWDGNDLMTNKKIIEVVQFSGSGNPRFSAPLFRRQNRVAKRVVFEYSKQASMTLRYDTKAKMIVFDHLAPSQPTFEGQFQYYGPDFSYDGLFFNKDGRWQYVEDIDIKNPKPTPRPKNRKVNHYESQ